MLSADGELDARSASGGSSARPTGGDVDAVRPTLPFVPAGVARTMADDAERHLVGDVRADAVQRLADVVH